MKPWLNEDGTLKQHARYLTGEDGVNDSKENREMIGVKFVVVRMKANVAGGAKDSMEETDISVTLAPDMEFYETDENGDLTHAKEYSTQINLQDMPDIRYILKHRLNWNMTQRSKVFGIVNWTKEKSLNIH